MVECALCRLCGCVGCRVRSAGCSRSPRRASPGVGGQAGVALPPFDPSTRSPLCVLPSARLLGGSDCCFASSPLPPSRPRCLCFPPPWCVSQTVGATRLPDHKMSKSCERCRERDEHHFWDMDDQGKYFFKVMVGDFRHQMTIPDKFAQSFRDKIQRKIKLKVCNCNTCTVVVAKYPNKLVLKEGWEAFVSMHDLRMGDFLVFKYNGNFQFKVLIFDPSGCVKASSHVAPNIGHHVIHVQGRQGDPIVISSSSDDQQPMQLPTSKRQIRLQRDGSNMCSKKMKISSSTIPLDAFGDVSSSEDSEEIPAVTSCIFSPLTRLTQLQRMKIEKKVRAVRSNTPMFGAVMKKSNITRVPCYLGFCREYNEYLPRKDQMLRLQRNGKRWQVRFQISKRNLRRLCQGWKQFASDNKLRIGDTCLFQLLKHEKRRTMNVHIIGK